MITDGDNNSYCVPVAIMEATQTPEEQTDSHDDGNETEAQLDDHQRHVDRIQAAKTNLMTLKDATVLSKYLQSESTVKQSVPHCDFFSRSCFGCIKTIRMSPSDKINLRQMEANLQLNQLVNNMYRFSMKYLFCNDPQTIFMVKNSNYETALAQAQRNYRKLFS